jgi:hypothetical protein
LLHRRAESEFYSFTTIRPVAEVKPYADVRWKDLSNLDLREKPELIPTLWFNEATVWPNPSRMPAGADPGVILTNGMDPGLGVRELHRQGITGNGVVVAVIDAPTGFDHPEYRGKVIRSTRIKADASVSMHGPAVLSLLVGDRCGTAPGAKVYYVSSSNVTAGVDWVLQQNRRLPAVERIRAVSVSQEQDEEWRETCQRAEAEDVLIVDLNQVHGWVAPCQLGRDRDDPGQCTPLESRGQTNFFAGRLRVPSAPRTCAESYRAGEYSYHHSGQRQGTRGIHGVSWAPPYCTGVLALGWQVRPDLSGRRMRELLFESAFIRPTASASSILRLSSKLSGRPRSKTSRHPRLPSPGITGVATDRPTD